MHFSYLNGTEALLGLGDGALESLFRWSDATYPSWTNWKSGNPSQRRDGDSLDCVKILNGGKWKESSCNDILPYVCQTTGG